MSRKNYAALREPQEAIRVTHIDNPLQFVGIVGGRPHMDFFWKEVGGKRRLIGNPNKPMRELHSLFGTYLQTHIKRMGDGNYPLLKLPSSTGFVKGSNPLKNVLRHHDGKFFFITDIWNAYPSVDLGRLAALIVYIINYQKYKTDFSLWRISQNASIVEELCRDELFPSVHGLLESFFSGLLGKGLAVGGPLSPFLFNLYCEAYVDSQLRYVCRKYGINFTRYADDNVFSRSKPVISDIRRELRECITRAGFSVNHRKSKVLSRAMGTVFVTKIGLRVVSTTETESRTSTLVFPQNKRRRLHGIIGSYMTMQMDWPEKVSGFIAEFLHYFKNVKKPTATDSKTFALCRKFEEEWAKHR